MGDVILITEKQYYCDTCCTKIPDKILSDPQNRECPGCRKATRFVDYDPRPEKEEHIDLCNKWAIALRKLGITTIPIKYRRKEPNLIATKPYQYQEASDKEFNSWIKNRKFENIAVMGGTLRYFDFDDPEYFKLLVKSEKGKKIETTVEKLIKDGAWVTETPGELPKEIRLQELRNTLITNPTSIIAWYIHPFIQTASNIIS